MNISTTRFKLTFSLALMASLLLISAFSAVASSATRKAPRGFFGIDPQDVITRADTGKMKRAGVNWIRVPIPWSVVQPDSANQFNWYYVDYYVKIAAREGVRVLPDVYATPSWIAKKPTSLPTNRHDLTKWRKFMAAMVDRYGPNGDFWKLEENVRSGLPRLPIRTWQIWNEVNFHYFATPVNPRNYGRLVNASAAAIRHHDRKAKIMLSGLYATPNGPRRKAMDADVFLKRLSHFVKYNSFDTISIHPYSGGTGKLRRSMKLFRRAAVKSGYRRKPMQITEMGWGSGRGRGNSILTGSQRAQAHQMRSAFNYLLNARHNLKLRRVYWFTWKDRKRSVETCSFCYSSGLFKPTKKLKPKKAWNTFKSFTYRK